MIAFVWILVEWFVPNCSAAQTFDLQTPYLYVKSTLKVLLNPLCRKTNKQNSDQHSMGISVSVKADWTNHPLSVFFQAELRAMLQTWPSCFMWPKFTRLSTYLTKAKISPVYNATLRAGALSNHGLLAVRKMFLKGQLKWMSTTAVIGLGSSYRWFYWNQGNIFVSDVLYNLSRQKMSTLWWPSCQRFMTDTARQMASSAFD